MIVFAAASGLCSVAPNVNALIAFRALQAIGGCMLNPVAMSIITNVFLEPKERAKAIGAWGATAAVSMAFGPLLGGALTQSIGWRAIFWINIPIGIIAVVLAHLFVPESKAPRARKIDPVGQVLVLVALSSVTYAVIEGRHHGWLSPLITSLFALSACAVVAILFYEPRCEEPMLDLRFFRSAPFTFAAVTAVGAFGAFSGFGFLNALYLQEVRGLTAFQSGFYTMPIAVMSFVFAPISGRLLGTYGARLPLLLAGLCLGLGSLVLTRVDATTSIVWLELSYVIFGAGVGLVNAPITNTAVSGMPLARAGVAAALASTCRQTGASFGVAVSGALVSGHDPRFGTEAGFTHASHSFFWIGAVVGLVIAVLAELSRSPWAKASAARVAAYIEDGPALTRA